MAAPIITISSYNKDKISDETGMTTCSVVFTSDTEIEEWEARAGGNGHGSGLLVGSWNAQNLVTSPSMDTDSDANGVVNNFESGYYGSLSWSTALDGAQRLNVTTGASNSAVYVRQNLSQTFSAGDSINIKIDAKVSGSIRGRVVIEFRNASWSLVSNYDGGSLLDTSGVFTTYIWSNVVVPASTVYIRIVLKCESSGSSSVGTIWYKNVSVVKNIPANASISFDVDNTELTQGDGTYRINVYGKNSTEWSDYE